MANREFGADIDGLEFDVLRRQYVNKYGVGFESVMEAALWEMQRMDGAIAKGRLEVLEADILSNYRTTVRR